MFKKLLFCLLFILSIYLTTQTTSKALNTCHFYIDDIYSSSTNIPFYFYENSTYLDPNSFPITKYKSTYTYIETIEQCESIEKQITSNTLYSYSSFILYSDNSDLYSTSILKTKGTLKAYGSLEDKLPPVFNGYKELYKTNIDSPIPLETILKSITALDETDGDITYKIEIIYENYSSNIHKLGVYTVMLSVNDSLNNKSTLTIHIDIEDTTPPIIDGIQDYISYLSEPLNIEQIKAQTVVTDNYYKNLEKELYVCEDTYSKNKNKPGIYHVFLCVNDLSNNYSTPFKTIIEVKDDIKPIIEGLNYYTTSISSPISIQEIMYSLAASDSNIDISENIYILEDYYSSYKNTLGEKHIFFEVNDTYGNISSPFKVTINLIDDIPPTIFGLNTFTSFLSHPYSLSYIKQQLTALDNYDNDITHLLEIIEDTYTQNINNKGTYYLTLQVQDSSNNYSSIFKITIENIDDVSPFITGIKELEYELESKPAIEQIILDNYIVSDNIDQSLKIEIVNDTYSQSLTTGSYYVELTCIDSSNNICVPFQAKINVVETLIDIKEAFLYLPTDTLYSLETINNLINIPNEYILIEDTYTPNYLQEGQYTIIYQVNNKTNIEITIETFKPVFKEEIKKETFIDKLKRFFKSIINFIKNIFISINYSNNYQDYLK